MTRASMLDISSIRLDARARDREDAIRQAGALLVAAGCVVPAYVDGMLAREASFSTYLGTGIALPHGRFEDRKNVRRSGISFLQFRAGILWDEAETAHIVIGLASLEEEHLEVLANLGALLDDAALVKELAETRDKSWVMERLTRPTSNS